MKNSINLFLGMALTLCLPGLAVQASDCLPYQDHLHWRSTLKSEGGFFEYHAKLGPLICTITSLDQLLVSDVSDPDAPRFVGELDFPFNPGGVWTAGSRLLVSGRSTDGQLTPLLAVVDVDDPQHPTLLGSTTLDASYSRLCIQDDHVIMARRDRTIAIYEIAAAGSLQHLNTFGTSSDLQSLVAHAGLVYAGTDEELIIFDLSDPLAPLVLNSVPGYALAVACSGDLMLVYDGLQLDSFDISDPAHPVFLDGTDVATTIRDITFQDGLAAVAIDGSYEGLFAVSDLGQVDFLGMITAEDIGARFVSFDQDHLYYGGGRAISIMALGNRAMATVVSQFAFPDWEPLWGMMSQGRYAFAASGDRGLKVYDLGDPTAPVLAGSVLPPGGAYEVALADHWAFVIGAAGLNVFDITDPVSPLGVASLPGLGEGDWYPCVCLADNILWIRKYGAPVEIVDISDPTSPRTLLTWEPGVGIVEMQAADGLLHIADFEGNYRIYSTLTLPPVELAVLNLSNELTGISIQDNLALVGCSFYGAAMVDFTDPADPLLLDRFPLPEFTQDVLLHGDTALVGSYGSLQVLDVSDPRAPINIGTVWETSQHPLLLDSGHILLWYHSNDAFHVAAPPCEMLSPAGPPPAPASANLSIYPNPFNPQTTIQFDLSEPSVVSLEVFDLAGKRVRTLTDGQTLAAGTHALTWDGRDGWGRSVASGVYLVRLAAGEVQAGSRLVLVR